MQAASISNGTCGSYGSAATLIGKPTQSGLTTGCYLFTLTGTDNVGNVAVISTTVIVDGTPPPTPTLAFTGLNNAYYSSSLNTLFFRKAAGGTYTVTASSSDAESGVNAATRSRPSPATASRERRRAARSRTRSAPPRPSLSSARTIVAINGAGGSSGDGELHRDPRLDRAGRRGADGERGRRERRWHDELEHDRQLRDRRPNATGARLQAPARRASWRAPSCATRRR